jgi:hypothetical protein
MATRALSNSYYRLLGLNPSTNLKYRQRTNDITEAYDLCWFTCAGISVYNPRYSGQLPVQVMTYCSDVWLYHLYP